MATAIIRDHVVWLKHVHGDPSLTNRLAALASGEPITLTVDGVAGKWSKMEDGKDGRATPGIRPLGAVKDYWNSLFNERRGESVTIELGDGGDIGVGRGPIRGRRGSMAESAARYGEGKIHRTEASRRAAFEAFRNAWEEGYTSDGTKLTRDEMHDRALDRQR